MVTSIDLRTPFAVGAKNRERSRDIFEIDEDFADFDADKERCSELIGDKSLHVYLIEIGTFANSHENMTFDYLPFDTNDIDWWRQNAELQRMGSRGYGVPENHRGYATPYVSAAEISWPE